MERSNKAEKRMMIKHGLALAVIILLMLFGLIHSKTEITGLLFIERRAQNHTQSLGITIYENSEYDWILSHPGELRSIKLEGSISKTGSAKVYIQNGSLRYLIFDSAQLEEGSIGITGYAVHEPEQAESLIDIKLEYSADSEFDPDNDGIEPIDRVIDFTIENTTFNWDVDKSKLCTKWEVYSVGSKELTAVCYGNKDCCALISLQPYMPNWDDIFYLNYLRHGAGIDNRVYAKVIYAGEDYSEIYYSDSAGLDAKFYLEMIEFEDVCLETCLVSGLYSERYKLVFEIENSSLTIANIDYSVIEEALATHQIRAPENRSQTVRLSDSDDVSLVTRYIMLLKEKIRLILSKIRKNV